MSDLDIEFEYVVGELEDEFDTVSVVDEKIYDNDKHLFVTVNGYEFNYYYDSDDELF